MSGFNGMTDWEAVEGSKESEVSSREEYEKGYDEFIQRTAERCGCCPECHEVPCDDCLAGGMCFAGCECEEIEEMMDDYEGREDEEYGGGSWDFIYDD